MNFRKEHTKFSKTAIFGCEMLNGTENIAKQSWKILYTFVSRAEVCN